MEEQIRKIFEAISEYHEVPVRLGSRCEANVYYHVENLSQADLRLCAHYLSERIVNVCSPYLPDVLINLPGGYTGCANFLAEELENLNEEIEVINLTDFDPTNGKADKLKNAKVVLVDDVITTARSCLEAHSLITIRGAQVMCWAALIDRTLGPGPVPVVAAITGTPVKLLGQLS